MRLLSSRTWSAFVVCFLWLLTASGLHRAHAQEDRWPPVELSLSANGSVDAAVTQGWPLLLTATVLHENAYVPNATPFVLSGTDGFWSGAVVLRVRDETGNDHSWPFELVHAEPGPLVLDSDNGGFLAWWLAPEATTALTAGLYSLTGVLDSSGFSAPGFRSVSSRPVRLQVVAEPGALSFEEEAEKYLRFAAFEVLRGRDTDALGYLDILIENQPEHGEAWFQRGQVLEELDEPWEALRSYRQGLAVTPDNHAEEEEVREPPVFVSRADADLLQALDRATTFHVSVVEKPAFHPHAGEGHTEAFALDGFPGRELYLVRGSTYTFRMRGVPASSPFVLMTGAAGESYTEGVVGAPASGTDVLTFTPGEGAPEMLYYGSTTRPHMGWRIRIRDASTILALEPPDEEALPSGFEISPVYPNPISADAQFTVRVGRQQHVLVAVYDVLGRRVRTLHDGTLAADAPRTFVMTTEGLSGGLYVIRVEGRDFAGSRTVIVYK